MKTNLLVETQKPEQLELLLRIAREMGINVLLLNDAHEKLSEADEQQFWQRLAQNAMANDWQHPDNDIWDAFIASKLAA
jgi:hypothetical protein